MNKFLQKIIFKDLNLLVFKFGAWRRSRVQDEGRPFGVWVVKPEVPSLSNQRAQVGVVDILVPGKKYWIEHSERLFSAIKILTLLHCPSIAPSRGRCTQSPGRGWSAQQEGRKKPTPTEKCRRGT